MQGYLCKLGVNSIFTSMPLGICIKKWDNLRKLPEGASGWVFSILNSWINLRICCLYCFSAAIGFVPLFNLFFRSSLNGYIRCLPCFLQFPTFEWLSKLLEAWPLYMGGWYVMDIPMTVTFSSVTCHHGCHEDD